MKLNCIRQHKCNFLSSKIKSVLILVFSSDLLEKKKKKKRILHEISKSGWSFIFFPQLLSLWFLSFIFPHYLILFLPVWWNANATIFLPTPYVDLTISCQGIVCSSHFSRCDLQTYTACVFLWAEVCAYRFVCIDKLSTTSLRPCRGRSLTLFLTAPRALGTKVILPLLQIYNVVQLRGHVVLLNTCEG